uniref:Uncharacterized protein SAMR0216 n=1 Tax=Streptomyces ambofaciens (strain ATCC 23877 / 3486 / DSM 40053 / JCM 4204 / NBRC 12836 / NRRL B-2516) TaxID=278992 RepID=Q1RQM0_STRA7|nr:unknown hypothetical protein [Streptomyces ambofaciens ATCC 23877]CAJ87925.1 hypothetical protein SAMR0216 [Streptomyces ambofaciens ATCC 23877]
MAAACWWARTMVESIWTSQSMSPAASAWAWMCYGIQWQYEPETITLDSGAHYRPDLRLPKLGTACPLPWCRRSVVRRRG